MQMWPKCYTNVHESLDGVRLRLRNCLSILLVHIVRGRSMDWCSSRWGRVQQFASRILTLFHLLAFDANARGPVLTCIEAWICLRLCGTRRSCLCSW